jgi:hypothetical protein
VRPFPSATTRPKPVGTVVTFAERGCRRRSGNRRAGQRKTTAAVTTKQDAFFISDLVTQVFVPSSTGFQTHLAAHDDPYRTYILVAGRRDGREAGRKRRHERGVSEVVLVY